MSETKVTVLWPTDEHEIVEVPLGLPKLTANTSPNELVDALGSVRRLIKVLERFEGFCKEAINARLQEHQDELHGDRYDLTLSTRSQNRLDTEKLKKEYGEEWYKNHCKQSSYTVMTVKPREPV